MYCNAPFVGFSFARVIGKVLRRHLKQIGTSGLKISTPIVELKNANEIIETLVVRKQKNSSTEKKDIPMAINSRKKFSTF